MKRIVHIIGLSAVSVLACVALAQEVPIGKVDLPATAPKVTAPVTAPIGKVDLPATAPKVTAPVTVPIGKVDLPATAPKVGTTVVSNSTGRVGDRDDGDRDRDRDHRDRDDQTTTNSAARTVTPPNR